MRLQRLRTSDSAEMAYIELVDRFGELRKARPVGAAAIKDIKIDKDQLEKAMRGLKLE